MSDIVGVLQAAELWPQALELGTALILLATAIVTSALTAAVGIGGGLVMLAVLGSLLPVAVVIPIHTVVQLGSNTSRALLLKAHVQWPMVGLFSLGALFGIVLATPFYTVLDEALLLAILAVFILLLVWGPKPALAVKRLGVSAAGGAIGFATLFVGATGPLALAALPRDQLSPQQTSATHAMLMVGQNAFKVIAFIWLGFAFKDWLMFLAAMVLMSFIGSYLGKQFLDRLPGDVFRKAVTWLLTLLAVKMLYDAFNHGLLGIL
ncbi:MAG: sulfite exporter TauE/SafE family protein [Pseudomonadales bacterium]